ncbi:ABC transporter ATP-binding protein [Thalassotalea fusca]
MNQSSYQEIIVSCKNLTKYYGHSQTNVHAVKQLNLEIKAGEMLAIYGPSGSGKSTLLNLIGQLDIQSSGEIVLFGKCSSTLSVKEKTMLRREKLGFIFQNFNLMPVLTAVENVELALTTHSFSKQQRNERAMEMLSLVGLAQRAHHFPHELSGGQQQRVGVARALVHQPSLVMADEPTANLDSKSSEDIVNLMKDLCRQQQVSFVFSTHDPRILAAVDRSIKLDDGEVVS